MLARSVVLAAAVGAAAAFAPVGPMGLRMSSEVTRRDVALAGAASIAFGAVAPANAQIRKGAKRLTPKTIGSDRMPAKNFAPVITIFDHRGCQRRNTEYKGDKSGTQEDEMMVKVAQTQLNIASPAFKELANSVLAASLSTLRKK